MYDPYAELCAIWRSEDEQADAEARWEAQQAGDDEAAVSKQPTAFTLRAGDSVAPIDGARIEILSRLEDLGDEVLLRVRFHVGSTHFDGYTAASLLHANDPAELQSAIEAAPLRQGSAQELVYALSCIL